MVRCWESRFPTAERSFSEAGLCAEMERTCRYFHECIGYCLHSTDVGYSRTTANGMMPLRQHPIQTTSHSDDIPFRQAIQTTSHSDNIPFRRHPIQTTSHSDDIPFRRHLIQTTSHSDDIPFRRHLVQTTSHSDEIPFRRHPIQTTSHSDDISFRQHSMIHKVGIPLQFIPQV